MSLQGEDSSLTPVPEFRVRLPALLLAATLLSGCTGALDGLDPERGQQPIPASLVKHIEAKGMTTTAPVLIRIFKTENVLELWKEKPSGEYALLKSYEICKFSGHLGPKFKEGDRQAPEGFYEVNRHLLNPNSRYYLSINMGFPNAYDRAHGRTGSYLMVHGDCMSIGCYAMTDAKIEEIYGLVEAALAAGQPFVRVHVFPFRMTAENVARHGGSPWADFWTNLKEGYDSFEQAGHPPNVTVRDLRYHFEPTET